MYTFVTGNEHDESYAGEIASGSFFSTADVHAGRQLTDQDEEASHEVQHLRRQVPL